MVANMAIQVNASVTEIQNKDGKDATVVKYQLK